MSNGGAVDPAELAARSIRIELLDNGLTCAIWPDPAASVVTMQIWIRVGSSYEAAGQTGLAHMLEHLMFRGTDAVPDGAFDEQMEALGASINAATWLDYTFYTSTAPATALRPMLELEADRLHRLHFTDEVFVVERDVVANERRQVVDSDPESQLSETFHREALHGSCYAWPTIGWAQDIADFSREAVFDFYREHYTPHAMLVSICGPIDLDEARAAITETLGAIPDPGAREPCVRVAPRPRGRQNRTIRMPIASPRLLIGWPGAAARDPRHPTYELLAEVLGGGDGARLPMRLEVEDPYVLDVVVGTDRHELPSLFSVEATIRPDVGVSAVEEAILAELADLATQGPAPEELAAARRRMATTDALSLARTESRAEWMGESWVVAGDPMALFGSTRAHAAVSVEDVRKLAAELMTSAHRTTLRALPGRDTP